MAKFYYCLPLLVSVAALACSGAQAQLEGPSPSPLPPPPLLPPLPSLPPPSLPPLPSLPPGPDCMSAFLNLSGCLSYVMKGSNDTAPMAECCQEVSGTYDSNPICLCELLAGGANSMGISIDDGRALKLPSLCHLDGLSPSLCAVIGIPIPSPSSFGSSPSPSPGPASGPRFPGLTAPPPVNFAIKTSSANLFVLIGLSVIVFITEIF
ncbi:non-specific lipid transfer protein GPI-anchored 31-like [Curcuma longa]|uniref:non-specific lipid transfer protein GPI-anchored 31-like n=1 Tax=Curcuma longa TaxID=136217 RepID=UPI003D9F4900